MAERIGDPVQRLTRATRRIAAGDLTARVIVKTADELQRLDKVAYVRFASVYRHFRDIGEFMSELKDLLATKE